MPLTCCLNMEKYMRNLPNVSNNHVQFRITWEVIWTAWNILIPAVESVRVLMCSQSYAKIMILGDVSVAKVERERRAFGFYQKVLNVNVKDLLEASSFRGNHHRSHKGWYCWCCYRSRIQAFLEIDSYEGESLCLFFCTQSLVRAFAVQMMVAGCS